MRYAGLLSLSLLVLILAIQLHFLFPSMTSVLRSLPNRIVRPLAAPLSFFTPRYTLPTSQPPIQKRTMAQSIPPDPKALTSLPLIDAIKLRRSVYALNDESPIPDSQIVQLVKDTLLHVPSAFNSQSTRTVLVVGDEHKKFWDMTAEEHKKAAGDDEAKWQRSKPRIDGFHAAYGTILFFESAGVVKKLQDHSPAYAPLFPEWSEHTSGMHQLVLWTALEAEGFGANLQHYQYVKSVEDRAKETYDLPSDWVLKAQLVFGGLKEGMPTQGKEKLDTKETVRVFGAKD